MSLRSIVHDLKFNKWNLAFIEDPLEDILKNRKMNLHWMKGNNKKQWFADPFILDVTDSSIICLVEELSYSTMKGRIARLEIDRSSYYLRNVKILLELPTHLSFPFIYRKDGNIYILPENSSSGSSIIYKYDFNTDSLVYVKEIANRPLTDAIIFSDLGDSYLLSTELPTPNGQVLNIYSFNNEEFKIEDKPIQVVEFKSKLARNAGEIFECGGKFFRPAQDCNGGYGKGVIIQELSHTDKGFSFEDFCSFYPDSWKYHMGYHTFNQYKGMTVVDAHGYRFPILARFLEIFSKVYRLFVKR